MEVTDPAKIQALVRLVADEYSRKILIATREEAKSVEELSKENQIPLSTCYRRVHEMIGEGTMIVDRIEITPEGKRSEYFRSAFSGFSVRFENGSLKVEAVVNEDIAERLHRLWIQMK